MKPWMLALILSCLTAIGCGETKSKNADRGYRSETKYAAKTAASEPMPIPAAGTEAPQFNTETYDRIQDNAFLSVNQNPLSTFSIDVDTASYANVRRFLTQGVLPPPDAVRIEELVNYFSYDYAPPAGEVPFSVHAEVGGCPWHADHRLVRIAIKGKEIPQDSRPPSNLVFLVDVSGSMNEPDKLPLVKTGLKMLIDQLNENDRVAIVVYASATGLVLPSTTGDRKETIAAALEQLQAGGSTNGGQGIQLAYEVAIANFIRGGTNRVILATDGDFNVGITDQGSLTRLIAEKAKSGVFLSVLGFGQGDYKDSTMEKLADQGNGNYAYVDTANEARKVFVEQMSGTLITIAKDVKIQVEFNQAKVDSYRLIGYENRLLRAEDFRDDTKDAGEIGAGHTVTALYEVVPMGKGGQTPAVDPLKYQQAAKPSDAAKSDELLTVKLRDKAPDGNESTPLSFAVVDGGASIANASPDFQFAAAVAGFGILLRDSEYKGNLTFDAVLEVAQQHRGADREGYRAEFIELVKRCKSCLDVRTVADRPRRAVCRLERLSPKTKHQSGGPCHRGQRECRRLGHGRRGARRRPVGRNQVDVEDVHAAVVVGVRGRPRFVPMGRNKVDVEDIDKAVEVYVAGGRLDERCDAKPRAVAGDGGCRSKLIGGGQAERADPRAAAKTSQVAGEQCFIPLDHIAPLVKGTVRAKSRSVRAHVGQVILPAVEAGRAGYGKAVVVIVGHRIVVHVVGRVRHVGSVVARRLIAVRLRVGRGRIVPIVPRCAVVLVERRLVPLVLAGQKPRGPGVAREEGSVLGRGGAADERVSAGFGASAALAIVQPVGETYGIVPGDEEDWIVVAAGFDDIL